MIVASSVLQVKLSSSPTTALPPLATGSPLIIAIGVAHLLEGVESYVISKPLKQIYLPSAFPVKSIVMLPELLPLNVTSLAVLVAVYDSEFEYVYAAIPTVTDNLADPLDFTPIILTLVILPGILVVERVIAFTPALDDPKVRPFLPLE